ncbi:MAG: methylenetetrahydrofolate reductase [Gammaproteobacteria bacterium]|nr:methylenetetrahydrofolate reductase [Gammaproteobacteria bacterium]MDE0367073.1 methylenetetrahydrofolate reductase [Gammaproteobacteria bacterium]
MTGQLRLYQDTGRGDVIRQAECLAGAVDAVAVTDCPYGVLHMSGVAVAAILLQQGIDPLLQFSARDRNRLALKSELLGAAALGVTSLLLQRGERLPGELQPEMTQVFDTGAKKFLTAARQLGEFQSARGEPELLLGTMATVFDPAPEWQPAELNAKLDAGARFVQTQICLDLDLLRRYMKILVAAQVTWRCHVVVSVPVLTSAESARWLYENLRGSVVPEGVVKRFDGARDPEAIGVDYCAETIRALQEIPGIGGVNVSTTGDAELIAAAVDQAAVRFSRPVRE